MTGGEPFVVLDVTRPVPVTARVDGDRVVLGAAALSALGWPTAPGADAARDAELGALAAGLGRPLALDVDERVACVGASARERTSALAALRAPDFALPDLAGRVHRLLARGLAAQGRAAAAERHFVRGGELAPHDFTIRRGSMPIRGIDPMGPVFRGMVQEWAAAGHAYYRPLDA